VGKASVHVLHISTKEEERGVFPKPGTDSLKGGGEGDWETVLTGKSPGVDVSMVENEKQGSRAEVQ
jgi:hypothetical protein